MENRNNIKIKISSIASACDDFCNEFNKYKLIPSFEELFKNAMHLPPKPYEKMFQKTKNSIDITIYGVNSGCIKLLKDLTTLCCAYFY